MSRQRCSWRELWCLSGEPTPPPVLIPPRRRGGGEIQPSKKLCEKTARREYVRPYLYTYEFRCEVSNIPSSNRGSQRRRRQSEPGVPFGEDWRGKRREGEGDGAGGTHHVTSTFGLSCRQRLLRMRANVYVQDRALRVLQGCSRLHDMPMSGAMCQPRAPDLTGRDAEQGGHWGKEAGEAQAAEGENEGGTAGTTYDASATG